MRSKLISRMALILLAAVMTIGCAAPAGSVQPAPAAQATATPEPQPTAEPVMLTVAGSWPDCRALDAVAAAFMDKYPNCTVTYECLQDYYSSLEKRLAGTQPVDLFFTTNIQQDSALFPYTMELYNREGLDLSNTFDGLIQNSVLRDAEGGETELYSIPLGAEMRGLYVNVTLLKSVGASVPTDQASLLDACAKLKAKGYIPMHANPGNFAQLLLYPWICNLIVHASDPEATYARVDNREPGVSELFREPYQFLYTLVENGYYDYKRAQSEQNLFIDTTDEAYARDFLNIQQQGDTFVKVDDLGRVAFMPSAMSLQSVMEKTREDYHSEIEYVFIPAPVGPEGGYTYLSPSHSIAASKTSANAEWAVKFLNFLFEPESNKLFAEAFHVMPNTKEAFSYIRSLYDVPDSRISHLGQVTFSYGFYQIVTQTLVNESKGNNPKYMQTDAAGNTSLYPLDYYMQALEESFQQK